jgi:FKBP-type peptidyl-prolyl cis-trans isomerase 2
MKKLLAVAVGFAMLGLSVVSPVLAADKAASARVEKGKLVTLDYSLTVDGNVVDKSTPEKPFKYVHGSNMIIKGLEAALDGMKVGDSKKVTVEPKDGYGEVVPNAFFKFPKSKIPSDVQLKKGQVVTLMNPEKKPVKVVVSDFEGDDVVMNANHPLAGKTLNFEIKIVSIENAVPAAAAPTDAKSAPAAAKTDKK